MEFVVFNSTGSARTEWVNGREYLVAPMTLIVPGVLPGSQGPLYYPPAEIARNVQAWAGIPLTINHPYDPLTNEPLTASAPGVWGRQGVGKLVNPRVGTGGRLQAEGRFRADNLRRVAPQVYKALLAGTPVELSTGLYTHNEPSPGTFNGRDYSHVARNYRPDHLAVLPDQKGACSLADGCGVLVNANPFSDAKQYHAWAKKYGSAEEKAEAKSLLAKEAGGKPSQPIKSPPPKSSSSAKSQGSASTSSGDNCGIGSGGFQPGNTCAKGGGSSLSSTPADWKRDSATVESWGGEREKIGVFALDAITGAVRSGGRPGEDYPEAAVHFTYRDSQGKLTGLVCGGVNPEHPKHLEIAFLATAPGSKLGDTMMTHMFKEAAKQGRGIYLNAAGSSPGFYKRWTPSKVSGSEHFWDAGQVKKLAKGQTTNQRSADWEDTFFISKHYMNGAVKKKGNNVTENSIQSNNAKKCPECGGSMRDGECDDCGYEENCSSTMNAWSDAAREAAAASRKAAAASKVAGGTPARSAAEVSKNIQAVETAGKTISRSGHEALAKAHDSMAATHETSHTSAMDKLEKSGVYGSDVGGEERQPHYEAAASHREAATLHRQAAKEKKPTANEATEPSHQSKWSVWRAIGQALGFTRNVQGRGHADGQFRSPPVTVSKDVHASATQGADHAGAELEGSQTSPDGRGKGEVTAEGGGPPIKGQEEDDHNAKELMKLNQFGTAPHDASKDATVASLRTEHDKGFSHAQAAMTASAGADSEGAAGSHEKAAKAHEKAATDARVGGDAMAAADHDQAAALHRTAASMHTAAMNRPPTTRNQQSKGEQMTRTQIVARLTANCKCEKSKAAINSLSDEALVSLLANAKATGSLADTSGGGGTVQAGGEEKTSKDKNDEEFDDDVVTKKVPLETNGKKTMNAQQWLAAAPPEIRGAVQNAMQIEAAAKGQLIERLTANVQDPTVKQQLVVLHSGKDLKQLKLEVQGLPPAFNTIAPGLPTYGATYPGLPVYGSEATLAGNAADDGVDDLLTAPTLNWSEVAKEGRHAG